MNQDQLAVYIKENLDKVLELEDDYVINTIYSIMKEAITFSEFTYNIEENWLVIPHWRKRNVYAEFQKNL